MYIVLCYIEMDLISSYLVKDFCTYIHSGYWSIIFFSCDVIDWFWCHSNTNIEFWGQCFFSIYFLRIYKSMVFIFLSIFLLRSFGHHTIHWQFLMQCCKIHCLHITSSAPCFKCLIEFNSGVIWAQAFFHGKFFG